MFLRHNILVTLESRCCPSHFNNNLDNFDPAVMQELKTVDHVYMNRTTILELSKVRQVALNSSSKRMTFDSLENYTDGDLINMTGLNKEQLLGLYKYVQPHIRNTPARSSLTTLGIFLFKMKSGLSNKFLSMLFGMSYLRQRLSKLGLDPSKFSGHSLRRGGCVFRYAVWFASGMG